MTAPLNLIGKKFGHLTVTARHKEPGKRVQWICKCDCGGIKYYLTYQLSGNTRKVKTCGQCQDRVFQRKAYVAWCSARRSAFYKAYKSYTGVPFHPAWDDFKIFLADVGEPPGPNYGLRMKHKEKGYIPGNVYWKQTSKDVIREIKTSSTLSSIWNAA